MSRDGRAPNLGPVPAVLLHNGPYTDTRCRV